VSAVREVIQDRPRTLPEMLTLRGGGDVYRPAQPSRDKKWFFGGEVGVARQRVWYRSQFPLGDDPRYHAAALAYLSDSLFLSVALGPHGVTVGEPGLQYATLNHSIWFHEDARADDWVRYDQSSPWAGRGRALCHGRMYDGQGALVATTMQEGLLRMRESAEP
jgi:acyl-CoA thioesterase II